MDPAEPTPPKSKKFLKIALGVLATLFVLLGTAYFLTALKNARQEAEQALNNATEAIREPTEAEKLLKTQSEELDRIRAEHQTASTSPATTTLKAQVKSIDTIRNQILKQKTTAPVAPKTLEQQVQELDALRSALNK